MANYKIVFKQSVAKDLRPIPAKDVQGILVWIDHLAQNPRPSGAERLAADEKYRIGQGRYHLLYTVADDTITATIMKVDRRRDDYQHDSNRRLLGRPERQKPESTGGGVMTNVVIDRQRLEAFCQRWKIAELALFGSVLRDDFAAESDVDVLALFLPEATHGLFDLVRMQEELKEILGREVDLVERSAVEKSRNYIRRKSILDSAETIYEAR